MESHPTFEILQEIGKGETATVYRARDLALKRYVAIKELHERLRQDPRRMEQFWQEAQFLAGLEHDNIVQVHGLDKDRGWVVMELMRGGLDGKLAEGPLSPELVRSILRQALGALECLHEQGRLHGAVKPSNLLINDQGRVKLSDSMGSSIGSEVRRPTGLPKYLAPEFLNPEFGPVRPAADLYALGFTALELLVGSRFDDLFKGVGGGTADPQLAWMRWHSSKAERLPPAREAVSRIPDDLASVIDRLLIKEVSGRYAKAAEVMKDLENKPILLVEPAKSIPPAPGQQGTRGSAPARPTVVAVGPVPVSTSASSPHPPGPQASTAAKRMPTSHARTSPAPRWGRAWLNQKLAEPRVFYPVIASIVFPTLALALFMLTGGGPGGRPTNVSKGGDSHGGKADKRSSQGGVRSAAASSGSVSEDKPKPTPPPVTGAGTGTVTINTDPAGAEATVEGREADGTKTTPTRFLLGGGRHKVHVERPGYEPIDKVVEVSSGRELALNLSLTRIEGPKPAPEPRPRPVTRHAPEKTFKNSVGMEFVFVPAGEFAMGSPEGEGAPNEHPQHAVRISRPYYVGTTEVTQAQFKAVTGESPSHFTGGDAALPVETVSFRQAVDFCEALVGREKLPPGSYRLPTEAEWEFAAKGGPRAARGPATNPDDLSEFAWFRDNAEGRTHPTGSKKPNPLGLLDTAGNVWEWCADWYADDSYSRSETDDPTGPAKPGARPMKVLRGGSWIARAPLCRPTDRYASPPDEALNCYGFRVVRVVLPDEGTGSGPTPSAANEGQRQETTTGPQP